MLDNVLVILAVVFSWGLGFFSGRASKAVEYLEVLHEENNRFDPARFKETVDTGTLQPFEAALETGKLTGHYDLLGRLIKKI